LALLLACCAAPIWSAHAQTTGGNTAPVLHKGERLQLAATYADGKGFRVPDVVNTVTVAFFWNTNCAVCRDSLPELRANLQGWKNKPFSLLMVNLDRRESDWQNYEKLVTQTQMPSKGYHSVRMEEELPPGIRLPLTLLIDSKGQILQRFEGRLAPEVWDSVAELLP
jgi:thiol-disulfide isomerase/thioredoxin